MYETKSNIIIIIKAKSIKYNRVNNSDTVLIKESKYKDIKAINDYNLLSLKKFTDMELKNSSIHLLYNTFTSSSSLMEQLLSFLFVRFAETKSFV
jgi:hypothetical protein